MQCILESTSHWVFTREMYKRQWEEHTKGMYTALEGECIEFYPQRSILVSKLCAIRCTVVLWEQWLYNAALGVYSIEKNPVQAISHLCQVVNWQVKVCKIENIRKGRRENWNRKVLTFKANFDCEQCAFLTGLWLCLNKVLERSL